MERKMMMMMEIINLLVKRVRLAGYRRSSSTPPAAISTPISKTLLERSDRGKKVNQSESIEDQSLRLIPGGSSRS